MISSAEIQLDYIEARKGLHLRSVKAILLVNVCHDLEG